jgi:hypothetical protein
MLAHKTKGRNRVLHLGNYPTISQSDASIKFLEAGRMLDHGEETRKLKSGIQSN